MAHCWDEYLWKVHNARPLNPWASNVQLLDILIEKGSSWFPWHNSKVTLARVGSMLTVGDTIDAGKGWKQNVEEPIKAGLSMLDSDEQATNGGDFFKMESMANIQTSIKSSTSFLASITGSAAASGVAQFDVKGSKNVNCTITGVKSHRVIEDTLMKMVSEPADWRPDASQPRLKWSSKRGRTLWVVTEIMYANNIKVEAENQVKVAVDATVTATTAVATATSTAKLLKVGVSPEVALERDVVWTVTGAHDTSIFPFAFRVTKLDYDANGTLRSCKPLLGRSGSLSNKIKRSHMDQLTYHRSSSVSRLIP